MADKPTDAPLPRPDADPHKGGPAEQPKEIKDGFGRPLPPLPGRMR